MTTDDKRDMERVTGAHSRLTANEHRDHHYDPGAPEWADPSHEWAPGYDVMVCAACSMRDYWPGAKDPCPGAPGEELTEEGLAEEMARNAARKAAREGRR